MITDIGNNSVIKERVAWLIELDNLFICTLFARSLNFGKSAVTIETAITECGKINVKKAFW